MARPGSFADFVTLAVETVARIPERLTFEAAAALPCAGMTAYHALHDRLRGAKGQTILVWGASGGVGGFAVQLARIAGLRVIAAYSGHDRDYVLALGADEAIDWRNDDPKSMIAALTSGRGVDAILNVVGSERATADLELLAFEGAIACVAGLPDLGRLRPFTIAPSVHEIALGGLHHVAGAAGRGRLRTMGEDSRSWSSTATFGPCWSKPSPSKEFPMPWRSFRREPSEARSWPTCATDVAGFDGAASARSGAPIAGRPSGRHYRRFRSFRSSSHGRVFSTSSGVSQALRA